MIRASLKFGFSKEGVTTLISFRMGQGGMNGLEVEVGEVTEHGFLDYFKGGA